MSRQFVLLGMLLFAAGAAPIMRFPIVHAQDPNVYCARAGYDDQVKPIPTPLVTGARRLFALAADESAASVQKSTVFRCMNGKVWLCNYGANFACGKANTSRVSTGAASFCEQTPNSESVPMAATGHDTIYEWKCVRGQPRIVEQIQKVDPRGFIAGNWKQLAQ